MIKSFEDIKNTINNNKRKIAVACADDDAVLEAIKAAAKMGIAEPILVGDSLAIKNTAEEIDFDIKNIEIIDEKDKNTACKIAAGLVSSKACDMLMKGLVDTASFLRAVLDKEKGLRTGRILSHVALFYVPAIDKMFLLTDAAMNILPDISAKKQIIENAVLVANSIGIKIPKVAPICAVEVVNTDMQATIDAAILSKMSQRGQIKGCIIDGPLALDNAISSEASKHKGIESQVAGYADILVVPNIESGNIMYKTLTYMANAKTGAILSGASAPVILTSRADSSESKVNSIMLACLVSDYIKK